VAWPHPFFIHRWLDSWEKRRWCLYASCPLPFPATVCWLSVKNTCFMVVKLQLTNEQVRVCVFSTDEPRLHHSAWQADQSDGVEAFSRAAAEGRNSGRSSLLAVSVCRWLVMHFDQWLMSCAPIHKNMGDVTRSKIVSHDPHDAHSWGNLSAIARYLSVCARWNSTTTTTTILWPLCRITCISRHPS